MLQETMHDTYRYGYGRQRGRTNREPETREVRTKREAKEQKEQKEQNERYEKSKEISAKNQQRRDKEVAERKEAKAQKDAKDAKRRLDFWQPGASGKAVDVLDAELLRLTHGTETTADECLSKEDFKLVMSDFFREKQILAKFHLKNKEHDGHKYPYNTYTTYRRY